MAETKARHIANLVEDDGDVKSAHLDNVDALPTQTSHSGKFLTTDGSSASWGTVSVTPTAVSDQSNTSTGYFDVPTGTDAQRPGSPNVGQIRYNSTQGELEVYKGTAWVKVKTNFYNAEVQFLVVAGGGNTLSGNATNNPGGGGAGGLRSSYTATGGGGSVESAITCTLGTNYTVTVGGGQSQSVFATVTSTAGGQGGPIDGAGSSGGSGQGYDGGSGAEGLKYGAGGGGGAGGAGQNGTTASSRSGNGGLALANNITGTSIYYAGGGGGGKQSSYYGLGGGTSTSSQKGGGGDGSSSQSGADGGSANTGGGAGSNGQIGAMDAESGGSGIVILRFPNTFNITVGAGLTSSNATDGTDKVYTFTNGTGNVSFTEA